MKILKSFKYAFRGFIYCVLNETNMRIHTVIALYVLFFSQFFSITKEKQILLLLTISSVICSEMINTAIEKLADFVSDQYNPVIRIVKDIAAGAVVCCAFFSMIIGFLVFADVKKIIFVFSFFLLRPYRLILFIFSLVLSFMYVKIGPKNIKNFFKGAFKLDRRL